MRLCLPVVLSRMMVIKAEFEQRSHMQEFYAAVRPCVWWIRR